jgi:hypothetical protein
VHRLSFLFKATKKAPYFEKFEFGWPIRCMLGQYLRNRNQATSKRDKAEAVATAKDALMVGKKRKRLMESDSEDESSDEESSEEKNGYFEDEEDISLKTVSSIYRATLRL